MQWILFVVALVVFYILISLRVLRQYERGVVFTLGRFTGVRGAGLTLIYVPFQQMVRVSLRTVTMQIPSQKIITKDNVSIDIAAVAYYHVTNPENAVIAIENVYNAINQISQTTVRNVVGRFNLDQLLADTAGINEQIKNVIDRHTEPWGTQVTAVEIKDIQLPENMQRAMAARSGGRARTARQDRCGRRRVSSRRQARRSRRHHQLSILWPCSCALCRPWPRFRSRRTRPSFSRPVHDNGPRGDRATVGRRQPDIASLGRAAAAAASETVLQRVL